MERATLLSHGELILPEHLPTRLRQPGGAPLLPADATQSGMLENAERQTILQALREHRFNRTETAKALGISRRALLYKLQHLRELGFDVDALPGDTASPPDSVK